MSLQVNKQSNIYNLYVLFTFLMENNREVIQCDSRSDSIAIFSIEISYLRKLVLYTNGRRDRLKRFFALNIGVRELIHPYRYYIYFFFRSLT